jgi:Zn-dependent protease
VNFSEIALQLSVWAIPVILAITLHEAAHGFVAWRLGDDTAYRMGRVTFNPLRHIDLFGTIVMPALLLLASGGRVLFGYAKPVPVRFSRLRKPRRDMVLVAAAGPGINLAMAMAAAMALRPAMALPGDAGPWVANNLINGVWINVLLCVFNLLPIPPLDGGRVAAGLLPPALARPYARLEPVGILIVLACVFLLPWLGAQIGVDLNVFRWLVIAPTEAISGAILALAGIG